MSRRYLIMVVPALAALVAGVAAVIPAAEAAPVTFSSTAVNQASGLCMDVPSGDSAAANALLVQLPCTNATTRVWRIPSYNPGTADTFEGIPNLAPNGCRNSGLPRGYGTNFTVPNDPSSPGFFNTTAIGWDGNFWPVFEYLSGSFFARGVNSTFNAGGTTICGAMYSFSAYAFGGNPGAQSVAWAEDAGYL